MLYELHVLQRVWKVRKTFCNKKALPDISWARLKLHMVTPGGFEPSIFDLGGRCIILLCYGAVIYFMVCLGDFSILSRKFHENTILKV